MSRSFDEMLDSATEQPVVFVPMFLPQAVVDFLNNAAAKRGKSTGALIQEIFFDRLKEMAEEDLPSEGG